jgi:NAD(P)-dependent dehydrogenase (short-subunit alcohol dehydrogenase family)
MKDVKDKVAFITGGASGIGLGMAKAFVREGMKVVIADIRRDHLDEAMASLDGRDAVHAIELDVSDREAMSRAAGETERVFGKVHVLCNNAGIGLGGPMKLATYDDWDWVMSVTHRHNLVHVRLPSDLRRRFVYHHEVRRRRSV